jgi:hypothetical protein
VQEPYGNEPALEYPALDTIPTPEELASAHNNVLYLFDLSLPNTR